MANGILVSVLLLTFWTQDSRESTMQENQLDSTQLSTRAHTLEWKPVRDRSNRQPKSEKGYLLANAQRDLLPKTRSEQEKRTLYRQKRSDRKQPILPDWKVGEGTKESGEQNIENIDEFSQKGSKLPNEVSDTFAIHHRNGRQASELTERVNRKA